MKLIIEKEGVDGSLNFSELESSLSTFQNCSVLFKTTLTSELNYYYFLERVVIAPLSVKIQRVPYFTNYWLLQWIAFNFNPSKEIQL